MPRDAQLNARLRAESRAQIIAAARRLFASRGYFSCKVSDIAREAGMSTGNVYWYFEGKKGVLKAVLSAGFEAQATLLTQAVERSGTFREKFGRLVDDYVRLCREQSEFTTIFVSLLGHSGLQFFKALGFDTHQLGARYHEVLTTLLEQGQAEGVVQEVESDVLVMFFFSFFNGLMITYGEDWLDHDVAPFKEGLFRLVCGSDEMIGEEEDDRRE